MKDFDNTIDLVICEWQHWLKMCEKAKDDYDNGYFGGRAIVCDNILEKYSNDEITTTEGLQDYLVSKFKEYQGYKKDFIDENNCESEKVQGYIDETFFMLNLINQGPFKVN